MRKLLRCRRGSVAFATVIALVPLIGVVALGAEAGSWYATKQHAQGAADAAAISGAMALACSRSGSTASNSCDTNVVSRGEDFAAQNGFCNAGDSSYPGSNCGSVPLPKNTTRTVDIKQGTFTANTFTISASGTFVRAIVTQHQPAYLAAVLGLTGVTIPATAIAEVQDTPQQLCALGLGPSSNALTIGGTSTITGSGCGMMSDNTVKYNSTPSFSGSGWAVDAVTGCVASAGHCALSVPYNYGILPAHTPLAVLDTASFNSTTGSAKFCNTKTITNGNTCTVTTPASTAYGDVTVNSGGTLNLAAGTYFFYNASVKLDGTVNGTGVTLVLLGSSSLTIDGIVNLSAASTNSTSSNLNGVLIDDQATGAVTVNGGGNVRLGGAMYFPKADITWSGNVKNTNTACSEVVAKSITINGNAYFDSEDCVKATITYTQVVNLVQ
jgi:hypothetical protein